VPNRSRRKGRTFGLYIEQPFKTPADFLFKSDAVRVEFLSPSHAVRSLDDLCYLVPLGFGIMKVIALHIENATPWPGAASIADENVTHGGTPHLARR
jgi:hypothetical protein